MSARSSGQYGEPEPGALRPGPSAPLGGAARQGAPYEAPRRTPHRSRGAGSNRTGGRGRWCAGAATAVVLALAAPSAAGAPLPPRQRPVGELLTELRGLYRDAGAATQAFNAADEKLARQRATVAALDARLAGARTRLDAERVDAGRLARRQYRDGSSASLTPFLRLLLHRDPQRALAQQRLLERTAGGQALTVRRLAGGERRLDRTTARAQRAVDRQRELTEERKEQQDTVRARMDEVAGLLASLDEEELLRLRRMEERETEASQRRFLATETLNGTLTASEPGDRALRYALDQVGKPYRWGAEGPDSFDCSGLTQQAWRRAGRALPRTSQEQWRQLPRVPMDELRPGDLVVYFEEATHVAVYLGDGRVVHAPRPGTRVKVSPIAANPVLGAVRPDPSERTAADPA